MAVKVPSMLGSMSPTFQKAWYKRNKMELPPHLTGSVKQASKEIKPSERVKSLQAKSIKAYGATKGTRMGADDGSGETVRDTIKPLTRDQHSKVQAAARAAKAAEKAAAPKRAPIKSKEDRLSFLKKAFAKAKSPERQARFDVPTLDKEHDDLRHDHDLMHSVGVKQSYNEEVELDETRCMSAAAKLGRAYDRAKAESDASRRRGQELMQQIRDKQKEKETKKIEEMDQNKPRKPSNYPGQRLQRDYLDRFRYKHQETPQEREDRLSALATGDKAGRWAHGGKYEEVEMNEVSKKEAEEMLGGPVKEKPKMPPGKQPAGYRYVRGLARKAMKAGMNKMQEAVKDAADVGEYDYEGDMTKSQLRSILFNAKRMHDMLEDNTNLPEWVQSKVTLAEDYISTAANYMQGEMNEEAELEKLNASLAEEVELFEKAPPGSKYERMVKHIKAGYAKGGLTPKEKSIAYATAWKAYKKNEEVEQIDEDHADAYDKHMTAHYNAAEEGDWDKAETHAVKAEKAAARHFKATGKKIYDPGYTGSSKHVTQVKEEVEQVDEKYMGFKAVMAAAKKGGARNPAAVAASIGRKKYGKEKFQAMAAAGKRAANEEVEQVTESEGSTPTTPKEKELAKHHGDPNKITYGDVVKARIKSAAQKAMNKGK